MRYRCGLPRWRARKRPHGPANRDAAGGASFPRCGGRWPAAQSLLRPRASACATAAVRSRGRKDLPRVRLGAENLATCLAPSTHQTEKERPVLPPPPLEPYELRRFDRIRRTRIVHRLFGRSIRHRANRYERTAIGFGMKFDVALDLRKQSMVGAHAHIEAGMPGGAALTGNDVTGNDMLAAEDLDAKALALGITSVSRRSACFFVSHGPSPTYRSLK